MSHFFNLKQFNLNFHLTLNEIMYSHRTTKIQVFLSFLKLCQVNRCHINWDGGSNKSQVIGQRHHVLIVIGVVSDALRWKFHAFINHLLICFSSITPITGSIWKAVLSRLMTVVTYQNDTGSCSDLNLFVIYICEIKLLTLLLFCCRLPSNTN